MKISAWMILTLSSISLLLSSCGPQPSGIATPVALIETPVLLKSQVPNSLTETPSALGQYLIPAYYPESYISIVDGSKNEKNLVIYSSLSDHNWNSVIKIFNSHYPWIQVTTIDTGTAGPFAQYDQDISENKPTADMLVSSDPVSWLKFFEGRSVMMYSSNEDLYIPDMAKSVYGSYFISSEPMVIIYNKKLVAVPPKNMAELASFVKISPSGYRGQIATTDVELNPTGFAINWFWTDDKGPSGWDILKTIGESHVVLLDSESQVVDAVNRGRAKIGYFIGSGAVIPDMETHPNIGWAYMSDNQPILLTSMAITAKTGNPNSAKLMLDFILSQEGQYSIALGGLTPFRSDISGITDYHLDKILTELGDNNVHLYSFDTRLNNQTSIDEFLNNWRSAVHKEIIPTPEPSPTK